MSWFNLNTGKPRKVDVEFEGELSDYYSHIKTITTVKQASEIPPDVDEFREDRKELKNHPENSDFARLGLVNIIPSELHIDPTNPPKRLTAPKQTRTSKRKKKDREYTQVEMETIYKLTSSTEKQRLTKKQGTRV